MRKFILALAGLACSIGPCLAAFGIFQTYLPTPDPRVQVSLTDPAYGGVCDAVAVTRVVTTSGTGNRDVAVTVNTFASGDVGKTITIPGAGAGGNTYVGTIAAFTDAQNITVGSNISTPKAAASTDLIYGTDNLPALVLFKAAFQGTTPVQLNLPGNCGFLAVGGGAGKFPFGGIQDLIVAGNGTATSGLFNFSGGNALLGGAGQYQDNGHSLRTNTATAGDSCVIAKTQPAVTISAVEPNFPFTAVFTASSTGTTMTVTAVASGTIVPGAIIGNARSEPGGYNQVLAYGTNGTTGVGGTGTYAMSVSTSFISQTTYTVPASYTGSIAANTGVLTVSSVEDGVLAVGQNVFGPGSWNGAGGNTSAPTTIQSQLTGTPGGVGTYQLDNRTTGGGSGKYQSGAQIRVTLNSTTGLTSGDTIYLTGMVGTGQLPQRVNGLKWIKVINGTQIDLFQWTYDGGYISGGTGGGDRTSIMPPGSKVMMSGWTNQSYWGAPYSYPSNPHWFEYKTVTTTNSSTHEICFDSPLVNTYKETWPQYNLGSLFEVDAGGPATIYVLDPTWETTIEFKDFTLHVPGGQTYSNGRNITWRNIVMVGSACVAPTQNVVHNWIDVYGPNCTIETDKILGTWNISGATTLRKVDVQSSSFDEINVSGLTINNWFGGAKRTNIDSSTFTCTGCVAGTLGLGLGTLYYGMADEASVTNSSIGSALGRSATGQRVDDVSHPWSMSGGVITIPNAFSASGCCLYSEIQTAKLVPGHYVAWQGAGGGGTTAQLGRFFKVIDVTQDLVNTYVQTSEAGGFPTGAWTTNGLSIIPHPAPMLTTSGLTSSETAISFNGCPAASPMFSCANYTFVGGASGATAVFPVTLWGEVDTFTFTNNVPYTGGGALNWSMSQFGNWQMLKTDLTTTTFGRATSSGGMINTKLPSSAGGGTRTLNAANPSGLNTQAGDLLAMPPAGALFGGAPAPAFSANTPSDSPEVTVTLRTNQNLPP